jgi:hypothetical protein
MSRFAPNKSTTDAAVLSCPRHAFRDSLERAGRLATDVRPLF